MHRPERASEIAVVIVVTARCRGFQRRYDQNTDALASLELAIVLYRVSSGAKIKITISQ